MERYIIFGIIKTIIFSLIIVFGLWLWITNLPYSDMRALVRIMGMVIVSVGIVSVGVGISLIVLGKDPVRRKKLTAVSNYILIAEIFLGVLLIFYSFF